MSEIPTKYLRQIRRYEPVETEGLTFYPILVEEYEEYLTAKAAIEFMHQRLPRVFLNMPLLQAYFALDNQSVADEQLPTGLMVRAVLFLALSLRLGQGLPVEKRIALFRPRVDANGRLKALLFSPDGEEICEITPAKFQRLRPILAAQNGLEIPPDDANPELVDAEKEIAAKKAPELDLNLESLISTVAALSGADEKEMYEWPIAKLQSRQRALHRALDYLICGVGEAQGTKWKKGNPVPNPFFDRKKEGSAAKVALSEFASGAALDAVREGIEEQAQ
jgi:hypothetical protein